LSKPILSLSILLTGILLGFLHHQLKPMPSEKEIGEYARGTSNSTNWKGQIAPDFDLKMTTGEHFRLSDNIGKKIIVLNFFATWCGPCREEMPELTNYFNAHKDQSFMLVGIDAEEKQDIVDQFMQDLKVGFSAGIDEGSLQKQYRVSAFPTTVLIGVDGKVQFYEAGALVNADVAFDNLLRQNQELLRAGKVISPDDYLLQAQKQTALPQTQAAVEMSAEDQYKFDSRGKRIISRMDCPCGCEKKVQACTCNTSSNIKKALSSEDFKNQSDDEIVKVLNKRFCSGGM
jgi:thiol-disulfide isomerase/thioredoxin